MEPCHRIEMPKRTSWILLDHFATGYDFVLKEIFAVSGDIFGYFNLVGGVRWEEAVLLASSR